MNFQGYLNVSSSNSRCVLVILILNLLQQQFNIAMIRSLHGDLVQLCVALNLLLRAQESLIWDQETFSAVCAALDFWQGQNRAQGHLD